MLHLQLVLFFRNIVDIVGWEKWRAKLSNDFSTIAYRTNPVNGETGLGFASGLHRFVHMVSVHALATELRQQGGMQVNHAPVVSLDEIVGNHQQEPSQHDEINVMLIEYLQHLIGFAKLGFGHDNGRNILSFGTHQGVGI